MKPLKRIVFCGLLPAALVTASLCVSTQWAAKIFSYQKGLGRPVFTLKDYPIYNPTRILTWYLNFHKYAPGDFNKAATPALAGLLLAIIMAKVAAKMLFRDDPPTSHGSASWAESSDLKKAGLLDGKGVVLGLSKDSRYLRHDGPEHVLCMAPTRSGKGVGIIIPTLLTWPSSVVITDIKGENWGITSGYRKKSLNNLVMKFDPTSPDEGGVCYNPLEEIRIGTNLEVKDTQNIADILVDPQGTGQQDHWAKTGHALLVGAILHVMYSQDITHKTLSAIATCLSNPEKTINETLNEMLSAVHDPDERFGWVDMAGNPTKTHPVVAAAARELLNKSENERSGVLSTAMSFLGLYRDPIVAKNTRKSDFRISDLIEASKPVSLYLVVPPSDLSRTRPLMRMILNQIGRALTEKMEFEDGRPVQTHKKRLLLLLDEFPALGRLDFFESALAFIAGYGIKALLIVQSLNQLNKAYSRDNAIFDNCHVRVVHTPNDLQTAELVSRMLSQKTEVVRAESHSGERGSFFLKNVSRSSHEVGRPLLTAGEVLVLPSNEEIIFCAGYAPIKAQKLFYFKDQNFLKRVRPAPNKSDCCRLPEEVVYPIPPHEPEILEEKESNEKEVVKEMNEESEWGLSI